MRVTQKRRWMTWQGNLAQRTAPKQRPALGGPLYAAATRRLLRVNQAAWIFDACLPFGTLGHFEADLLAFLERLESLHVDCREVREQVLAAVVRGDEPKALRVVEPLTVPVAIMLLPHKYKNGCLGSKDDLWRARNAARIQRGTAAHRYSGYWSQTAAFLRAIRACRQAPSGCSAILLKKLLQSSNIIPTSNMVLEA